MGYRHHACVAALCANVIAALAGSRPCYRGIVDSTPIKVLMIEDDERLAALTTRYLEGCGFVVVWRTSGLRAMEVVDRDGFDVVLLDLMLPGRDGIDVCRDLRTKLDVPIIMITARREESDRVLGLESGADDYILKPFSSRELVSRIRAVVRRARGQVVPRTKVYRIGELSIDVGSMTVSMGTREVVVTSYEFALLRTLAERPGRVLSREQLLELTRDNGAEESFERSIDVQISRLRQKLGDDARQPRYLKTIRGHGYMLAERGNET